MLSTHSSHEYVVRVIAQEYNITTSRAAGIIQLQHNEEQLKKDPTFHVNHGLQAYVDETVRRNIAEIYDDYGEVNPLTFVEDPIASTGSIQRKDTGSPTLVRASELMDVEAMMRKTRKMELEEAKVRIDNHIYVEDVDDRTRKVALDQEATRLLKMTRGMENFYEDMAKEKVEEQEEKVEDANSLLKETDNAADVVSDSISASSAKPKQKKKKAKSKKATVRVPPNLNIPNGAIPYPENNRGHDGVPETRRPRWKFAAQIINTHMLENPAGSSQHGKKVAARAKRRRHGRVVDGNTLIEEGGKVRVASVAELEQTSWKHVRNESEFMFKGVKDAWLRRQLEGEVGGWGHQDEQFVVQKEIGKEEEVEGDGGNEEGGENEGGDGEEESNDEEGTDAVKEE